MACGLGGRGQRSTAAYIVSAVKTQRGNRFGSIELCTTIRRMQRRLAQPLCKGDVHICEAVHIKNKIKEGPGGWDAVAHQLSSFHSGQGLSQGAGSAHV